MKRKLWVSGIVGVCVVALAVGLGVGLSNGNNDKLDPIPNEKEPWKNFRLPTNILPLHYDMVLKPDVVNDISNGEEIITVDVVTGTEFVIIHAIAGDFTNIESFMVKQDETVFKQKRQFYHNDDEAKQQYYVVELEEPLGVGQAELHITWSGALVGTLVGINKVTYRDDDMEKYIIATKFEPTYAREAFPCFDEPAMKANYSLVMYHDESHKALWNMPVVSRECGCTDCAAKMCKTTFMTSPKMGTYQPTFIVHNMTHIEETYKRESDGVEIPLRVYTPMDKINQADHAMHVQEYVMAHYESEFGLDYPLPKLDLIAIPDFVTGAMEQWGLITYRETSLLFDPNEGSTSSKQSTSATIAHEMVHQWFGNLVTMEFWDNIWLNEGFATFYKYGAIEKAFPEEDWDTVNQQIYSDIIYSLNRDVTPSSRPIIADVRNPNEITAAFDWVIYQKGSSVIHMMKETLGTEPYHNAILAYLDEAKYSNATEETLLKHVQLAIDENNIKVDGQALDATELWMPFLRQPLYPLLEVKKAGNNKLSVSQAKDENGEFIPFLHNPEAELGESAFDWKYPMIIRYQSTDGEDSGEKLLSSGGVVEIESTKTVKLNKNQTCFYRTKYDEQLQAELVSILNEKPGSIDVMDRVGLMDDAFHLAISGDYTYDQALDFVNYMTNEKEPEDSYYAWNLFSSRTSYMRSMLAGSETGTKFVNYFRPAISAQFDKMGFEVKETDTHMEKRKRSTIVSLAVSFEVDAAQEEASILFKSWLSSGGANKPHPDVRGTVYNLGVSNGGNDEWNFVYKQYMDELVASEKRTLMRALASTKNVTTIDFMLNTMAADKTIVLEQDFFTFISYIQGATTIGNQMAFDWARVHWDELDDRFSTGDRNFGRMVPGIVDGYNTPYGLWAATDFFAQTEAGAGEGPRSTALDQIESNIKWVEDYIGIIDAWLTSKQL